MHIITILKMVLLFVHFLLFETHTVFAQRIYSEQDLYMLNSSGAFFGKQAL